MAKETPVTRRALQLIVVLGALPLLSACDERWSRLDPPKVVQMSCKLAGSEQAMVLIIDTGLGEATWANQSDGPKAKVIMTPREYRIDLPASVGSAASRITINRYDGAMSRQIATPNVPRQNWRCTLVKSGPSL